MGILFQASSDVLFKDVAGNPAYQPTIPLMRLVREEYVIDSDEFHGDQRSSKATVYQEMGEQDDMVSKVMLACTWIQFHVLQQAPQFFNVCDSVG